jgi:hypothetical protein
MSMLKGGDSNWDPSDMTTENPNGLVFVYPSAFDGATTTDDGASRVNFMAIMAIVFTVISIGIGYTCTYCCCMCGFKRMMTAQKTIESLNATHNPNQHIANQAF